MRKIILTFVLLLFAIPMIAQTQTDVTTTPITIIPPALKITTGAGANKVLTSDADGNATWQAAANGATNFLNASDGDPDSVVYVDAAGNVGIGTTAPGALLTVNSKSDTLSQFFGDKDGDLWNSADSAGLLQKVNGDVEIGNNNTMADLKVFGDLTVSGDDITMTTNTLGAILVADGTNFNPVVMSGDASIVANGTVTVADDSHEHSTMVTLAVTGTLSGETGVTLDTDAAIVLTAAMCRNSARFNNDADVIDYTLPAAESGLVVLFYDIAGGVITIDPFDGTDTIYLDGVSVGAGDAIDSPGAIGNFIALMAIDDTRWISLGRSGTWIDGGAD